MENPYFSIFFIGNYFVYFFYRKKIVFQVSWKYWVNQPECALLNPDHCIVQVTSSAQKRTDYQLQSVIV